MYIYIYIYIHIDINYRLAFTEGARPVALGEVAGHWISDQARTNQNTKSREIYRLAVSVSPTTSGK